VLRNGVFPALEAFEQRLDNPTCYWVFYEYFLRAAVGDDEWKTNTGLHRHGWVSKKKRDSEPTIASTNDDTSTLNKNKRLATCLDEAFAFLLFKNNFFAWLAHMKHTHKELLMTDYDTSNHRVDSLSLPEIIMNGDVFILDLRRTFVFEDEDQQGVSTLVEVEDDFLIKKMDYNDESEKAEQAEAEVEYYKETAEKYRLNVEEIRRKVKDSAQYNSLTEAMVRMDEQDGNDTVQKKKRRRVLKEMKAYTGVKMGDERSFRGWSNRAFVELLELKTQINADKMRYERFGRAYKALYRALKASEEDEVTQEDAENDNDQFAGLWEEDD
jgi:hypothetical protein